MGAVFSSTFAGLVLFNLLSNLCECGNQLRAKDKNAKKNASNQGAKENVEFLEPSLEGLVTFLIVFNLSFF